MSIIITYPTGTETGPSHFLFYSILSLSLSSAPPKTPRPGERNTPSYSIKKNLFIHLLLYSYSLPSISLLLPFLSLSIPLRSTLPTMANAASGMAVHDDCKLKFMELKTKRSFRFIVYKIEEVQKQVIVEKVGEPNESYEDFTACLPENECRYAVFDFDFMTKENVPKSRIFFVAWSPDTSRVRSKMIYASSKDRFKRELDGIQVELQATDPSEMGLDVFNSRVGI